MASTSYSIDALIAATEKKSQVRKAVKHLLFRGAYDVDVPSLAVGFFDPEDRSKIKIDTKLWEPCGIMTKDGTSRETKVKLEESEGYNYPDPVREDMVSADRSLSFTLAQDFTRIALEAQYGMNLSGLKVNQTKGIAFDEPNLPLTPFYRYLAISQDYFMSDIAKPIFEVTCYLAAKQNELPKIVRKPGSSQETEINCRLYSDEAIGTPVRHWIDGVGFDGEAHGFLPATV